MVRVQYRPLPQCAAFLTGERASYPGIANVPFSMYLRSNELLGVPLEQFLDSIRFQQWGKLDQLVIEIGSID